MNKYTTYNLEAKCNKHNVHATDFNIYESVIQKYQLSLLINVIDQLGETQLQRRKHRLNLLISKEGMVTSITSHKLNAFDTQWSGQAYSSL